MGRNTLLAALSHRDGPVPLDFGATAVTGMHASCVADLRRRCGLERRPVKVHEPFQMLGEIEEDLQEALGVDVTGVFGPRTLFGFANEGWREARMPWGQTLLVPEGFVTSPAPDGGLFLYPCGDASVPPSGHMPAGGFFFDSIARQPPIVEAELRVEDNLEEFAPVSQADLAYFDAATAAASASGKGVIASFGGTGLGDIALVPAPFLKQPRGIRDVAEWYVSTVTRRDFMHELFGRQTDIALANLGRIVAFARERVDVLFVCGTDFGTQSSQFCSEATFRELYAPYYRRVNDWVHAHTDWRTFKHTCGAIVPLLDAIADCGFDVVNPVQCSAAGMEPERLKREYGDRLVFWGAGVDTQKMLPFGTPDDVRREVRDRCRVFSRDGGFVFNAIHNVQAGTPVENIVAMVEAVHAFNGAGG